MNSPFLLSGIFWTRNSNIFVLKSTFIKNEFFTICTYKYISVPKRSSVISILQRFFSQCTSCIFEHNQTSTTHFLSVWFAWTFLEQCCKNVPAPSTAWGLMNICKYGYDWCKVHHCSCWGISAKCFFSHILTSSWNILWEGASFRGADNPQFLWK